MGEIPTIGDALNRAVVIGAGPSGLAAAHELTRNGRDTLVLERLGQVGGLARTVIHDGCRYDIGPHRFFTKNREVQQLFLDVVAEETLRVPRQTRIFYDGKLFNYPLTPVNTLARLGPAAGVAILASYVGALVSRSLNPRTPRTFAEWITDKFGRRLFETFFQPYTEKVWGIPCSQISADWAAQRIKGLSLTTVLRHAIMPAGRSVRSLVDEFLFPRLGSGQFYERLAAKVEAAGGELRLNRRVCELRRHGMRVVEAIALDERGNRERIRGDWFLNSAPLTELLEMIRPTPPEEVLRACRALRYRTHIGVHLKVAGSPFPDNWVYVHSPEQRTARIANYRSFSRAMIGDEDASPLTVEYFAFEGDALSSLSDGQLVRLATRELSELGFAEPERVLDGFVIRSKKAYPVIEIGCQDHVRPIKAWLDGFENLFSIGRSGMFKYNNQDHAIATGLLAARAILTEKRYDPWLVNIDAQYHEAGAAPRADGFD